MKKGLTYMCLILIVACLFTSCNAGNQMNTLAVCASYGVPGMFCYDLKGDSYSCKIVEEDSYGRILYEYTAFSIVTEQEETVFVICQRADSQYVYYYEDNCYTVASAQNDLTTFKEINDWNGPFEERKMSRRSIQISFDLNIVIDSPLEYEQVKNTCIKELDVSYEQIDELCILDSDSSGCELYWLKLNCTDEPKTYYVIIDSLYTPTFLVGEDSFIESENLRLFKTQAGWHYGY